jgi:hypothetical protein
VRAALLVLLLARVATADGVILRHGHEVARVVDGAPRTETCTDDTATCTTRILRVLSGLSFGSVRATLGAAGHADKVAGDVEADVLDVAYPFGAARGGHLEILYVPDGETTRLRATLAQVDVLFSCRDAAHLHAPILGQIRYVCIPGAHFGTGATLGEFAWDPATNRFATRWGELDAVANLLGAPSTMAYLRGHLDVAIGVDAESVRHGDGESRAGWDHAMRAVASLRGLLRSADGRWEGTLRVEGRPAIAGTVAIGRDVGALSEARLVVHALVDEGTVITAGLDGRADYWRVPANSLGSFDSPTTRAAVYLGLLVEIQHAASR